MPWTTASRLGRPPPPPGFAAASFVGWGQVTLFGLHDGAQFRLSPPPPIHSGEFARDYNEVKEAGAVNSTMRPLDRSG